MKNKIAIALIFILLSAQKFIAQEVKFGKVTKKELEEKFYPLDSSANAVVLYKKHRTYYDLDASYGWVIITEIHERIKLYDKNGFDHATKKVPLYTRSGKDETLGIKAYTYNLENGKVKKTKLSNEGIYKEAHSKNWFTENFTLPNLKEGCIIEWIYTIHSPYIWNINNVICQYEIPIKNMDVKVQIPEYFDFKFLTSRYYPLKVNRSLVKKNYTITSKTRKDESMGYGSAVKTNTKYHNEAINENVYSTKLSDVPALVKEPYVNNLQDYKAKIDFERIAYRPKNGVPKFYNNSWKDVTRNIYENPDFGDQLNKKFHFKDDLNSITIGLSSQQEKMSAIFEFVKKKIKWNSIYGKYVSDDGIKKAYQDGVGNIADINLTLVAMLREAGLKAHPILSSSRNNGIPLFPTSEGFNYVIAGVVFANDIFLLDATDSYSQPNVLPKRALNWEGRLIMPDGNSSSISLYPNKYSLKSVRLSVKMDSDGNITGMMNSNYKNLNALEFRNDLNDLSEKEQISELENKYGTIEIEQLRIINNLDASKPIGELIKFSKEGASDIIGDKMYISPLLFLTVQENPFKLEERLYPIDYGTPWKNILNISIQIPDGFMIESKPKDISLTLPDNLGTYTMAIKLMDNKIMINSKTSINNALIGANYYTSLKEFYKQAIDNQLEKIVLAQNPL